MTSKQILDKYIAFFVNRGHVRIENSPLVPLNDPTTLFTSSGMQSLIPFLLGEKHPQGVRLVNVQNCFRAQDIDEVGDNRHTTFFRMLGNWSLGDPARNASASVAGGYFKKEQIPWFFEFLTDKKEGLGLDPNKLYVTVFSGFDNISKDTESENIWEGLFKEKRINPDGRIFSYGVSKNWWSRAGLPDKMPIGEPGGPDSEVFYDFGEDLGLHEIYEKAVDKAQPCHVNCDCGRYLEIGNSVFMQYVKVENGSTGIYRSPSGTIRTRLTEQSSGVNFSELPQKNVDFGGGLERLVAATENKQDIFETSLFSPIVRTIEQETGKDYKSNSRAMRIIADHLIASVFIAASGVLPSNKEQGYVLRRLIRRAIRYGRQLGAKESFTSKVSEAIIEGYSDTDPNLAKDKQLIKNILQEEDNKFSNVINEGLKRSDKIFSTLTPIPEDQYSKLMQIPEKKEIFKEIYGGKSVDLSRYKLSITPSQISGATVSGRQAFDLQQSFGFPTDMMVELAQEKGLLIDIESTREEIKKHQDLSRKGAAQKFAGGLADSSEVTVKGHTATHLMHQALRDVLGNSVHQTGSNITSERVRFDFVFDRKLTDEELEKVKNIVLQKIKEDLPVHFEIMPLQKAKDIGAIGLFDEKYGNDVKVYFVGDYSKEFCGGPHVERTSQIQSFAILKEEGIARGVRRIYAKVT